jgi:SET domain-containing protein
MQPIKKGTFIIEYVGDILTPDMGDNRNSRYVFTVSKKKDIDGAPRWNTARYINHSCRPNAEADDMKERIFIIATRNIMLGEEITYDYGKEYFNEYIKPKGCRCVKCKEKEALGGKKVVAKKSIEKKPAAKKGKK